MSKLYYGPALDIPTEPLALLRPLGRAIDPEQAVFPNLRPQPPRGPLGKRVEQAITKPGRPEK